MDLNKADIRQITGCDSTGGRKSATVPTLHGDPL